MLGLGPLDPAKLSRPVIEALELRGQALAQGIDPAVRPADVAAIARRAPSRLRGELSVTDAAHARSLISEAIAGLDPHIQVNMPEHRATRLLTQGGRFGNAYDAAMQGAQLSATGTEDAIEQRVRNELGLGMFGTGTNVYGTVHFGDTTHTPLASHAAQRLRLPARELDVGSHEYGFTSVVLGPRAMRNATFLPADTGDLWRASPVRAVEQLHDTVFEWMLHNFQLDHKLPARGTTKSTDNVFDRDLDPNRIADDFRAILAMPRPRAVAAIREHLTSDAVNLGYMEAQVRIANVDDIAAIHVDRMSDTYIPPANQAEYHAQLDALAAAAQTRGIPVRYAGEPLPRR